MKDTLCLWKLAVTSWIHTLFQFVQTIRCVVSLRDDCILVWCGLCRRWAHHRTLPCEATIVDTGVKLSLNMNVGSKLLYLGSTMAVTIKTRKFKKNPLLGRKQFIVDVLHPGQFGVSKADITEKLAKMYKVSDTKCISVFGFHTAFGGGKSSGMGLVYDNIDAVKKFEPKHRCKRHGVELVAKHKRIGRRNLKKMKGNVKKARRGKARTEIKKTAGAI